MSFKSSFCGTQKLRVLYLHEFGRLGGAELALLRLIDAIRPMGVEPLVVWPRHDATCARLSAQGIQVVRLKVPRWRHGLSLPLVPVCLFRLRGVLSRARIDLVHVNNYRSAPFGHFVSRWAGVPSVSTVRETIAPDKVRQYRLQKADALVAVSDSVARALVQAGVAPDRISTIRSGVSLSARLTEDERRSLREGLGVSVDDSVIGIVAHILPHKGHDDLVHALGRIVPRIPRVKCLVIGEAPRKRYLTHLLNLAERLGVRDRLILVGAQADVTSFYHAMDVFVLPSHTEGLPLTVLEAMAAGKPVVATSVGGIPEAVRHTETGLVAPTGEPERLAEAVVDLLSNPARARLMGEAGRERVRDVFTLEAEARQTRAAYCRVLRIRQQPPSGHELESQT